MAAPPPAHAPVDSDDPAVLALGPCAAAYVELETCLGDHDRDWTKCQAAVKALRNCVASKDQGDKKAGAITYRQIMKAIARFPSRNRGALAAECVAEWRANAGTPPGAAREAQRALAVDSLAKLRAYIGAGVKEDSSISLG